MLPSKCLICQVKIELDFLKNDYKVNNNYGENCLDSLEANILGDVVTEDGNNLSNHNNLLEKQLHVIFILKNVIELPKERLEKYLELHGNPEEWIALCGGCSEVIGNVKRIFVELQNISRRYKEAKEAVQEKIRNSFQFTSAVPEEDADDILEDCRSMVEKWKHQPSMTSCLHGDKLGDQETAANKVNDRLSTCLKRPSEEVPSQEEDIHIQPEDNIDFEDVADEVDPSTFDSDASDVDYQPDAVEVDDQGGGDSGDDSLELSDCEDDKSDVTFQLGVKSNKSRKSSTSTQQRSPKEAKRVKINVQSEVLADKDCLFQCDECTKPFTNYKSLMSHKRFKHPTSKLARRKQQGPLSCTICKSSFNSPKILRDHLEKAKRKCHICSKEEASDCDLICHLSTDHDESVRRFPCTIEGCKIILCSKYSLRKHLKRHARKPVKCNLCEKVLTSQEGLKTHQFLIHKVGSSFGDRPFYECPDCGLRSFLKDAETIHKRNCPTKTVIECQVCGSLFATKQQLSIHQDKQHSIKTTTEVIQGQDQGESEDAIQEAGIADKFPCIQCGKLFLTIKTLLSHEKCVHGDATKYTCQVPSCGYGASRKTDLIKHEALVHQIGIEDFRCDKCQHICRSKIEKTRHICGVPEKRSWKTHVCTICGSEFNKKLLLQNHILSNHEKIYKFNCDLCGGYKTNQKSELQRHLASKHSIGDWKCVEEGCTRVFHQKKCLENHVKYRHQGVARSKSICPICGKAISNSYTVSQHIKGVHSESELKPYKCQWCGKGFKTASYRSGHKKKCRKWRESLRQGQT